MHLTSIGKSAASVPFVYNGRIKMTVLYGPDALAARRDVASKLDHQAIATLRKPMHVDKPDWSLLQQLSDAGIGLCPSSGWPVLDPSVAVPALRTAIWRAYCGVASCVNTKEMGQTDEALEELKTRLHEHVAQLREVAPRSRRLSRSDGTLAKRSRGASPAASLSDEATDTGEPVALRKRRAIPESDDEEPMGMGSCAGLDDDELSALELDAPPPSPQPRSPPPSPPPSPQRLCEANSLITSGRKGELLCRLVNVDVHGRPDRCPKCKCKLHLVCEPSDMQPNEAVRLECHHWHFHPVRKPCGWEAAITAANKSELLRSPLVNSREGDLSL